MKQASPPPQADKVTLLRGGLPVSTYLGAFGTGLKETRLTAALAYVISRNPAPFLILFKIPGVVESVVAENRQEAGRTDIEIRTSRGLFVVEAKRGKTDPKRQASKYRASKRILLTDYTPHSSERNKKRTLYVSWRQIAATSRDVARRSNAHDRPIILDFIQYLEDHKMSDAVQIPEIYAREINNEETLSMFLKARIYVCDFEKHSRLPQTLYFAPHFARSIAGRHPGVARGISYIARIESIRVVSDWKEVLAAVKEVKGKVYLNKHKGYLSIVKKWPKNKQRSILFLGEPRLAFNPPVKKERLQRGRGFLSKNYLTFDNLFDAWNHDR